MIVKVKISSFGFFVMALIYFSYFRISDIYISENDIMNLGNDLEELKNLNVLSILFG